MTHARGLRTRAGVAGALDGGTIHWMNALEGIRASLVWTTASGKVSEEGELRSK
jgi:hypothetical protein